MIANPVLRSLFRIMGFVALIGNLATNILTLIEMVFHRKSKTSASRSEAFVKLANRFFVFNLITSDFFMGAYLLAVVCRSLNYS